MFKRPCFIRALVRSREAFGAATGTSGREEAAGSGIRVPAETIPLPFLRQVQTLLTALLQPAYLPRTWEAVAFSGLVGCPYKSINEIRNGVPTFVRMEFDCTVDVQELKNGDAILAVWPVNGIEVLPIVAYGDKPPTGAGIRLRLHGKSRLALNPRPPQSDVFHPGSEAYLNWRFFDSKALFQVLTGVLRLPYDRPKDVVLQGGDSIREGVHVFVGEALSRIRREDSKDGRSLGPPAGFERVRVLITDSDPQYICLSLKLVELGTKSESPPGERK